MPFRSTAQQRFAFSTGQPWADRWAKETDFSKLPKYVKRRRKMVEVCTCKEQISPGVTRIRGNLCNVHGRYGPCDAAAGKPAPAKKPTKGRAARPRKAPKPKQTPEQRAQAQAAQRQANVDAVKKRMADTDTGLSPGGVDALTAFASGTQPTALEGEGLARMGLAERAEDGSFRMTPSGRAAVSAMQAGDYQRAVDTISRGSDQASARQGRQAAATGRQQAAAQRRADVAARRAQRAAERAQRQAKKPAKAGSGGGKKPAAQTEQPRKPIKVPSRGGSALSTGGASAGSSSSPKPKPAPKPATPEKQPEPQLAPALQEAAQALSDGAEVSEADQQALIRNGLARLVKGALILTAAGQRATRKNYAGGSSGANETRMPGPASASPSGANLSGMFGATLNHIPSKSFQTETRKSSPGRHVQGTRTPDRSVAPSQTNVIDLLQRGQLSTTVVIKHPPPVSSIAPTLSVFKDASGGDRWLMVSSTAYRDRDKEIVSTQALKSAVTQADASGMRGPLRFWHVPGLDLGDCDFQATAQEGRFLIESGTFRSPALAAAVKAHAGEYQVSIGFLHPATEPDADGVYRNITIFERSLVPRGRAANPLTRVVITKELRMLTPEKEAQLKSLTEGDPTLLADLLSRVATTDKAAQESGATYKDDLRAIIREELADLLGQTEKAAPPADALPPDAAVEAKADMGEMAEEVAEEVADEAVEDATDYLGDMSVDDFRAMLSQAFADALAPLVKTLDIAGKMAGHMDELKGMMGGYTATKDDALAKVTSEVEAVKAQIADLSGSQPRILAGGFRASQSPATVTTDDTKIKEAGPAADPKAAAFGAFMQDLGFSGPVQGV